MQTIIEAAWLNRELLKEASTQSTINEVIEVDLSTLPVSDFIAADPSIYKHYEVHAKPGEGPK